MGHLFSFSKLCDGHWFWLVSMPFTCPRSSLLAPVAGRAAIGPEVHGILWFPRQNQISCFPFREADVNPPVCFGAGASKYQECHFCCAHHSVPTHPPSPRHRIPFPGGVMHVLELKTHNSSLTHTQAHRGQDPVLPSCMA